MLVSLHVKDLALIEENEVFWENGLNILTGETGAGKSVIIGSIRLALGAAMSSVLGSKGDKDCIRTGAQYALIELVFETKRKDIMAKMAELELPLEDNGCIFIQRKIMQGRSVCKVNGETITAKQLKELASLLIAIHGQHDTQTLLNVKKHSQILDEFGAETIFPIKDKLKEAYRTYTTCKKEWIKASENEKQREGETAFTLFLSDTHLLTSGNQTDIMKVRITNGGIRCGLAAVWQARRFCRKRKTGIRRLRRFLRSMPW